MAHLPSRLTPSSKDASLKWSGVDHPPPGIAGLVVFDTLIITGGAVNGNGGGVSITTCSPTFLNCTITQNSCTGNGGGVFVYHQAEGAPWARADVKFIGCTIIGNEAQDGGGMFSSSNGYGAGAQPSLVGCLVTENTASNGVGGIRHATWPGQTTVVNSIICGNVPSQIAGSVALDANSCAALTCVDDDGDGLPDGCQGDADGILHVPDEYATILIALQNAVMATPSPLLRGRTCSKATDLRSQSECHFPSSAKPTLMALPQ